LTRYQYGLAEEKQSYEDKYDLIMSAIQNNTDLDIVYLKTDDTKTRRRISPESIEMMTYMDREFEGVVARCHKRKAHRVFRIDRMLSVLPGNEAQKNR
ncbi:MAG: WYL domain-containing protein, partial [Candidatus Aminicenantes bacterium]|nr:WYL domain-containing protein [Candidatus Aminicenantes bacterium]